MGYLIIILSLLLSSLSFGQFKPVENLKFQVGSIQVSQLACLQDRERRLGTQVWGPRFTSDFSFVFINKPSYLAASDLSLQAYASSQSGYFLNSRVYNSTLEMYPHDGSLTLTDKIDPNTWTLVLNGGIDSISSIVGVHTDKSKGTEYELLCSF
jgi:hypothetical protein